MLALEAQHVKRSNVEGSAAFAAFASRKSRSVVVNAQVSFQSIYDYVDTLAERPLNHPLVSSRQLHQALLDAVAPCPAVRSPSYYRLYPAWSDGGYLAETVRECRAALQELPGRASIAVPALRVTRRIVAYQTLNLTEQQGGHARLASWAHRHTPTASGLRWWETAASAGSSLGLFALIAAASRPGLLETAALSIERAYWPWIGAFHSLLDSLVDLPEDHAIGQRSLLSYYTSAEEATDRMAALARAALGATRLLPNPEEHALLLAAMASSYLAGARALQTPLGAPVKAAVLSALGAIAHPTMIVFALRRRRHPPAR